MAGMCIEVSNSTTSGSSCTADSQLMYTDLRQAYRERGYKVLRPVVGFADVVACII